ncbi:MAG: PIN domain-containing protein [Patescibacteria group bacterium]
MKRIAGSLDANVLLRLLLNDVLDQHKAALKLVENDLVEFNVADTVIIEIAFVLERHYQFSRKQICEAIDGLILLTQLRCNQILFEKALALFVKHRNLSFEDCCLSVYAYLNDAEPLWTFDRKLAHKAPNAQLI